MDKTWDLKAAHNRWDEAFEWPLNWNSRLLGKYFNWAENLAEMMVSSIVNIFQTSLGEKDRLFSNWKLILIGHLNGRAYLLVLVDHRATCSWVSSSFVSPHNCTVVGSVPVSCIVSRWGYWRHLFILIHLGILGLQCNWLGNVESNYHGCLKYVAVSKPFWNAS